MKELKPGLKRHRMTVQASSVEHAFAGSGASECISSSASERKLSLVVSALNQFQSNQGKDGQRLLT